MFGLRLLALQLACETAPQAQQPALHFRSRSEATILASPAFDIAGELTLEVWVRPSDTHSDRKFRYIISHNMKDTGYGLLVKKDNNVQATGIPDTRFRLKPLIWTHLAYVHGASYAFLYANGNLIGSSPVAAPLKANGSLNLCVGCSPFVGEPGHEPTSFEGDIRDVRIWSLVRTPDELGHDANFPLSGNEPGLAVYLPMNEGGGTEEENMTYKTPALKFSQTNPHGPKDPIWIKS